MSEHKTLSWLSFYIIILFLMGPITQFTNPDIADSVQKLLDFYLLAICTMLVLVLFKFTRTKQKLPDAVPFNTAIINYAYYFAIFFILSALFFFSGGWGFIASLYPNLQLFNTNWLSLSNVMLQFIVAGSEFIVFIFALPYLIKWNVSFQSIRIKFIKDILERSVSYIPAAAIAAMMHTGAYFRIFVVRHPTVDPYGAEIIIGLIVGLFIAFIMFIVFYLVYIMYGTGASIALHHAYNLSNDWIN